jgi:ubiquitin carboxyl-terminal hydrolase 10
VTNIGPLQKHDSVHDIENALARISHLLPVELSSSGSSEASQQVLIEALPPVLVLHIKRFLYDVAADSIVKINKPVQFAPELEIPLGTILSFISPVLAKAKKSLCLGCAGIMAPIAGKFTEPVCYKLYGVLYHHGKSVGSGNYTVDVLHPNGDSGNGEAWLHIDDEVVSTLQHEDVFGGGGSERVDDRCVYMLFYCRTAPTQT